jgi:hypothetical protein
MVWDVPAYPNYQVTAIVNEIQRHLGATIGMSQITLEARSCRIGSAQS